MKGKSSSRVRAIDIMETPSKSKEEPQLSGAYIRSLVKHLSSSTKLPKDQTFKDTCTPKSILEEPQPLKTPTPPPTNLKKQVRRRLHTSRPYQERLLNMAEARREIVTALKYHRASMKQANEQLQQIQSQPPPPNPNLNPNPNIYQSEFTYPLIPLPYPTLAPLPDMQDSLNFSFMNYQPLGLNLSFQGFNNIDATIVSVGNNKDVAQTQPLSPHSSSSSSYSFSPPPPICTNVNYGGVTMDYGDANMHTAMGEKELEEIRSIGEKHEIEWNDTMNLVNSAWWSNFLEVDSMDDGINELRLVCEGNMDANASHTDNCYSQDSSLPCLDIGEIEWSEGDWLL